MILAKDKANRLLKHNKQSRSRPTQIESSDLWQRSKSKTIESAIDGAGTSTCYICVCVCIYYICVYMYMNLYTDLTSFIKIKIERRPTCKTLKFLK